MSLRIACLLIFTCISIEGVSAQTNSPSSWPTSAQRTASAPGVDVWQTLYPRAPQYNPVSSALPQQTLDSSTQPKGVNVGTITLFPTITGATFYDDNVFALSNNKLADWAFVARPELAMKSNGWSNAEVFANAAIEARRYARYESENQVNAAAAVGGTFALTPDMQLVTRGQYIRGHEDRGTNETIITQFAKPVAYSQYEAAAALNNRFGRFWTSVGVAGAWIDYEDADFNGIPISQGYRSGTITRVPVRAGFVVAPLTSAFAEVAINHRQFEVEGFDSKGYRVVGGMLFEPGPGSRVKGEIYAGYMHQDYNGFTLEPISTWTAGGALAWLLTDRWTLALEGQRDARETSLSGGVIPGDGVSLIESIVTLRADYRILPNVVVGAGASYVRNDFLLINREDETLSPLASVKYFVNPYLTLGFDYRYVTFGSDGLGIPSYTRNVYVFSANGRF